MNSNKNSLSELQQTVRRVLIFHAIIAAVTILMVVFVGQIAVTKLQVMTEDLTRHPDLHMDEVELQLKQINSFIQEHKARADRTTLDVERFMKTLKEKQQQP